jgi:hypothetical protein
MSSYRKIFLHGGGTVTVENGVVTAGSVPAGGAAAGPFIMPDISEAGGEFVSPIDGTLISSRSQLRAHNQRHGVDQIGNDYKFEQRQADMMSRYGRDPDGQYKAKYREHMHAIQTRWTTPDRT